MTCKKREANQRKYAFVVFVGVNGSVEVALDRMSNCDMEQGFTLWRETIASCQRCVWRGGGGGPPCSSRASTLGPGRGGKWEPFLRVLNSSSAQLRLEVPEMMDVVLGQENSRHRRVSDTPFPPLNGRLCLLQQSKEIIRTPLCVFHGGGRAR